MIARPELAAPAGSFETLEAALTYGADAVYVGLGRHNLRAHAPSFTLDTIGDAVVEAHKRGRRLYVALNTMPDDDQLAALSQDLQRLARLHNQPDAVIISDPGVLRLCRKCIPDLRLHLSTQTGAVNHESLAFWAEQGIKRVVLPRELTIAQVADLANRSSIETEIFVHGAMCMSISGRCLLGAYLSGRHPNRGDCPQPCRFSYRLESVQSADREWALDIEETGRGAYFLNAKDLNTLSILPRLVRTGVSAFKIEGRNKSVHYLGAVVRTYRQALDRCAADPDDYAADPLWVGELEQIDHRPYTTGFYGGDYRLQSVMQSKAASRVRVLGMVKGFTAGKEPVIDVKNPFEEGETIEVLPANPSAAPYSLRVESIRDLAGRSVCRAVTNCLVSVYASSSLHRGDIIRRIVA